MASPCSSSRRHVGAVLAARPARPLVGHLPELRRDRLAFYTACARHYGDIVALRFGPRPAVLLSHPDHVQTVLATRHREVSKHFAWRLNRPIFGEGLLTSEGDTWRRQRRLVQPAFHRHRITTYGAEMVAATERLLARWGDGETRDIHAEMMRLRAGYGGPAMSGWPRRH